jgi:hypothetical protein
MKSIAALSLLVLLSVARLPAEPSPAAIANPLIDYPAHRETVKRVEALRESRRLSETDFLTRAREAGTIVLDARSDAMFRRLHVQGAVNLSFPDFTADALSAVIPAKGTPVLIYCNNNFLGSPVAMASKIPSTSLNISTYVALTSYGYTNVYELGPLLDVKTTLLPLVGTETAGPGKEKAR